MEIIKNIQKIQLALSKCGIIKDKKNITQGYNFRSIDEIYNVLSPLLVEHEITIVPNFISRECEARSTKNGTNSYNVTVKAEFTFLTTDGSKIVVSNYGEAMDSGDKATNKAMSAAYKYACIQLFAIPTEGNNDTESIDPPDTVSVSVNEKIPASMKNAFLNQIQTATDVEQLALIYKAVQSKYPQDLPEFKIILSSRRKEIAAMNAPCDEMPMDTPTID